MTMIDRLFPRAKVSPTAPATTAPVPAATPRTTDPQLVELELRREHLASQLAAQQWDLGGLTYEMAIRDHFRMDVLVKHAAALQETDAELAEVDRLLRLGSGGAAGDCPSCGSPHSRGAVYCWSCGHQLMPKTASSTPQATPA